MMMMQIMLAHGRSVVSLFLIISLSGCYCYSTSRYDRQFYSGHKSISSAVLGKSMVSDLRDFANVEPMNRNNYESESSFKPLITWKQQAEDHYGGQGTPSRERYTKVVKVDDFGAKDGTTTEAFQKAWTEACHSAGYNLMVVPSTKTYHLKPITFSGPCKSHLTMKIDGTIKASKDPSDYKNDIRFWILFHNIQNLIVQGAGTVDGNGNIWWKNSCKVNPNLPCKDAPTALTFNECKNLRVGGLRLVNSQKFHLTFEKCVNVKVENLVVVAPEDSPNTDGIHVSQTQNIQILNSVIQTGDDCVSIISGSRNVKVVGITCGPGHGISIGSLGKGRAEDYVSDIFVNKVKLSGTTNGLRIKTWQGGSGYAKNIFFQNVEMNNVTNPIIIDQFYCDQRTPCPEQYSAVQVENVWYKKIKGTSASEEAIKFNCSRSFPCQGIILQGINLKRKSYGKAQALCTNIWLSSRGDVAPYCTPEK